MNAIRKATRHSRKPFRPVVSKAGRRVLEWLDKYGERYVSEDEYRQLWAAHDPSWPDKTADMFVSSTTLTALHNRGLITKIHYQDGVYLVGISPAGRRYLEDSK